MIPRLPIKLLKDAGSEGVEDQPPYTSPLSDEVEETNGAPGLSLDMSAAVPPKKNTKRAQVKNRDWRASIQAYNEL